MKMKKNVTFPKREVLESFGGGVTGPFEGPVLLDVRDIEVLLIQGNEVTEVLESGETVELTLDNVNKDNSVAEPAPTEPTEPPAEDTTPTEPPADETTEPTA
jgi:hypothetical protein